MAKLIKLQKKKTDEISKPDFKKATKDAVIVKDINTIVKKNPIIKKENPKIPADRLKVNIIKLRTVKLNTGLVKLHFARGKNPNKGIVNKIYKLGKEYPMCLTREQVSGMDVESNIVVSNPENMSNLIPGNIIDGDKFLNGGNLVFQEIKNRKNVTFTASSNLVKNKISEAKSSAGVDITPKIAQAVHALTMPSNLSGMPNVESNSEVNISTMYDSISVQVGASGYFMGFAAADQFKFSSEKYNYMYVFKFEQKCLSVNANQISSPDDVLFQPEKAQQNWYYINEVTYGRRLYIILESEFSLESYSNDFKGSWNWGVVGAELTQKTSGKSFTSFTNIRAVSQGGQPIAISDPKKVQNEINKYFKKSYNEIDIVPLEFRLTNLNGEPISLVTEAFLDGNNCLKSKKIRIRIKELNCLVADDGGTNEQIYGNVGIMLSDEKGVPKMIGKISGKPFPVASIVYAKESSPIYLTKGKPLTEKDPVLKDKYLTLNIKNLDYKLTIMPSMKEEDDFTDDDFKTNNKFNMTIRNMLLEGESIKTFEFRDGASKVHLTVGIEPI
ncbi:MAG TPA: hypothetical protein VKY36_07195 [Moheibacter sp.]|nr:hypothetical protein [Moheibacter sp.]